ncbi:MAG: peptidylprolyl isomerase [Candidatus Pacearchaeota archaeon]|nr:peptidylprolyl isomerase [Candidatus Pacearchaeota archaeon]
MTLQKNDFIEIEFTGRIKDGEVFDSNISEELKKLNSNQPAKPFIFCLGQEMFLNGIDEFLIGKEIGNYEIELKPEKAFGLRNPSLIQMIPLKVFIEHKVNPIPGTVLNFDNRLGKVLTVSGGRIMVDFNNPLAGKEVVYKVNTLRKVEDINEKINSLNEFFFRKEFKFEIKENKLVVEAEKGFRAFVELFKDKFKEILGLDLEVKEIEPVKDNRQEEKKILNNP